MSALLNSFVSSAAQTYTTDTIIYQSPFNEPSVNAYCGYISILYSQTPNGAKSVYTFAWSVIPDDTKGSTGVQIQMKNNVLEWALQSSTSGAMYTIMCYQPSGAMDVYSTGSMDYTKYFTTSNLAYIHSYQVHGNVTYMTDDIAWGTSPKFAVMWADSSAIYDMLYSVENAVGSINTYSSSLYAYLKNAYTLMNDWCPYFGNQMVSTNDKLLTMIELLQITTEPTEEEENESEQLVSATGNKKTELDSVSKESKVDKVDSNNASSSVDRNIDFDSVGNYGVLLSTITSNKNVLQLIMIVLSVATVSYVLFGKR